MCGICGIIGKTTGREKRVKSMLKAMQHRGPDDFGVLDEKNLTVGMVRLSILDLSPLGHQPMSNPEKNIWIVYNGEMYNFQEEKAILENKGYKFRSHSDTEVVLNLYQEYGDNFLSRMSGIFALAIVDLRPGRGREKILLARDQLGIKPLIYTLRGKNFIFASELKCILASDLVKKNVDSDALRMLLTYGSIVQPKMIIKDVKMLLPGYQLIYQNGRTSIKRYWQLKTDRFKNLREKSYRAQTDILRHELEQTVKSQMVSDAPIGAFLSSGVDSTLLVALMQKFSTGPVRTFSVGFEKQSQGIDETPLARKRAKFLGTKHTEVIIESKDISNHLIRFVRALDQPSVDGINSYFVSWAASRGVKVAISGTGGDEFFAGYPWFANMLRSLQNDQRNYITKLFMKYCHFLGTFLSLYRISDSFSVASLLAETKHKKSSMGREPALDFAHTDELRYDDELSRMTAISLRSYTQNQLLRDIDATSMFNSLEVRVPLLDKNIVDLALSLPAKAKLGKMGNVREIAEELSYRELGAKKILIDAGRGLLPENIDLQKKQGFTLPFNYWLKGELKDVLGEALSLATVKKRGFFEPKEVQSYYQRYLDGKIDWPIVWILMIAELWAREVLDTLI